MVEVRETRWWVSPFFTGGWWTSGVGSEKARPTAGEEPADCHAEEGERKDSEFRVEREAAVAATGFEAEQPMKKTERQQWSFFFFSLSLETKWVLCC